MNTENSKVNKKLLIVCGILICFGVGFRFMPTNYFTSLNTDESKSEVSTNNNDKIKDNSDSQILYPKPVTSPSISNIDLDTVNKYIDSTYILDQNELYAAKESGLYNTFSKSNLDNPFYQKYVYSKEMGNKVSDKNIVDNFNNSFLGSIASVSDFSSTFPSNDLNKSNQNNENVNTNNTNNTNNVNINTTNNINNNDTKNSDNSTSVNENQTNEKKIYLNQDTNVYHYDKDCKDLKNSIEINREEVEDLGANPCPICIK